MRRLLAFAMLALVAMPAAGPVQAAAISPFAPTKAINALAVSPCALGRGAQAEPLADKLAELLVGEVSLTLSAKALWDQSISDSPEWREIAKRQPEYGNWAWTKYGAEPLDTVRQALPNLRRGVAEIFDARLTQAEMRSALAFYGTRIGQASLSISFETLPLPDAEREQVLAARLQALPANVTAEEDRIAARALPALNKIKAMMPVIQAMLRSRMDAIYAAATPQIDAASTAAAQHYRDTHGASAQ